MVFFAITFLTFLTIASLTESSAFVLFTFVFPILYLLNLYFRRKRLSSSQPWPINEKVILITGASSGIGKSLAHLYAKNGASVILCARRAEQLSVVAEECRKINNSVKVLDIRCDVTNETEVSKMFEIIKATFNRLDCIVLNAGVSMGEPFEEVDYSLNKKIMDINYFGSICITYRALPFLRNSKKPRILVVNSIIGIIPIPLRTGYAASKFALRGFFESLQSELWEHEIFVTIAYPGSVQTEINKNRLGSNPKELDFSDAISSEECAQILIDGVRRGDKEILFSQRDKLIRLIEGVFPELLAYIASTKGKRHVNLERKR